MKHIRGFLRLFLFLFLLISSAACPIYAQTSRGDQLFAEGQALQNKKQYQKAIAKYKAAKVAYTSPEKKQMCDEQIRLCKPSPVQAPQNEKVEVKKKDSLVISAKHITFEASKESTAEVSIVTGDSCWTFDTSTGIYGDSAFVAVEKTNEGKSLRIHADINNSTLTRHQHILVSTNENNDTVFVEQLGKTVTLRASENLLNYKLKGGKKYIDIITNSDSLVAGNNNECWYVESKPEWIEVNVEVITKKTQKIPISFNKYINNAQIILSEDEKSSKLSITVVPLLKSDTEYLTGRRGEVIIASQSKRYKIIIVQQK